jgi:hypothetical protein
MENEKNDLDTILNNIGNEAKKQADKIFETKKKGEEYSTDIYKAEVISSKEVAEIAKSAAKHILSQTGWDNLLSEE